jgi:hypothetical protein
MPGCRSILDSTTVLSQGLLPQILIYSLPPCLVGQVEYDVMFGWILEQLGESLASAGGPDSLRNWTKC